MDEFKIIAFFICFLVGSIAFLVITMMGIEVYNQYGVECERIAFSRLISIDGRYDKDEGLFSGGSVNEKNLLFENGLFITLDGWSEIPNELRLGNYYKIEKCENNGGRVWYNLK